MNPHVTLEDGIAADGGRRDAAIGDGSVPGPITQQLMAAFSDLAGTDYVAQYLYHLSEDS